MEDARITAVIPTFRRPALLQRALESVLSQTETRIEVFVSDNASGDGTADLLADYAARDPRVRYVVQDENLGAARNFQICVEEARTPWVSLLSDDDALLPGYFAHALACLEEHPEARFFGGQVVTWNEQDGTHAVRPTKEWTSRLYQAGEATALMARRLLTWTGCLFDRALFDEQGPFTEGSFGDAVFQVRAAARHPFVVSLKPCALFTNWGEGSVHAMSGAELVARAEATLAELAADDHVRPADLAAMRGYWEDLPRATLTRRLKAALRDERWKAFDTAAAELEQLGGPKLGQRLLIWAGRRRKDFRFFMRAGQRHVQKRRGKRKRAAASGAKLTFEEVAARYAPVLLESNG